MRTGSDGSPPIAERVNIPVIHAPKADAAHSIRMAKTAPSTWTIFGFN